MMPKLIQPIAEFMYACNRLLTGTITRDTLTKEELEMLETCIELLTKRFISSKPSGEMSHGQLTGVEVGQNSEVKD